MPSDMPRRLTNGGTSLAPPARSFETTEPNDGPMMGAVVVLGEAGHHHRVGVLVGGDDRANDGQLVPHAGLARHEFADLDAGDVGLDRAEFAAIFHRSIGLQIVHVHVGRPTGQIDHDRRLLRGAAGGRGLGGAALARSMSASERPAPKAPIFRKDRRLMPSQKRWEAPWKVSMMPPRKQVGARSKRPRLSGVYSGICITAR